MGILDQFEEESLKLSDDMSELAAGEINPAQMGLRTLGAAGAGVGAVMSPVVEAALSAAPDFILKGLDHVVQGVKNTGYAKAATKWMEDNPEHARDITSAFNAMDIVGAGILPSAAKRAVSSAAQNMPNELSNFYGSGAAGQILDVAKAGPTTAYHMANQAFNPAAAGRAADGISSRLHSVAKDKVRLMEQGKDGGAPARQAPSFLEGQMDQSSLLQTGAGEGDNVLRDIFGQIQDLNRGPLDETTMRSAFTEYKPGNYEGMDLDDELISMMTDRVKKAQGIKDGEEAIMVLRHPTALTEVVSESYGGRLGSDPAKRMSVARKEIQKYNPDKTKFDSVDEAKEFMAVRALVDRSYVRKDGKPMTKADHATIKAVGPLDKKYKWKETGNSNVLKYYELKDKVDKGKKLDSEQKKVWDDLSARIERQKDNVVVDSKGRLYNQSSHKSAAKGLGGVNDQFVLDLDGNVLHFINDENDLFGMKVPGDKRVVSVTPPTRYNIFEDRKSAPDVEGTKRKKDHSAMLAEKYGAPKGAGGLRGQMGRAVADYSPGGGGARVARNLGEAGVLAGFLNPNEEE